jgi:hypothetical protein
MTPGMLTPVRRFVFCVVAVTLTAWVMGFVPTVGLADTKTCTGSGFNLNCVWSKQAVGPAAPGVLQGTEWVDSMECGPRRKKFDDAQFGGDTSCRNFLVWCPLAAGAQIDPTKEIVVYRVYATGTTSPILRTEIDCDVVVGARMPSIAAIKDEVTKRAPQPNTRAGGTSFLINTAGVFYATASSVRSLTDIAIPTFDLGGRRISARLHLSKTGWDWGDGSPAEKFDGAGQPYDDRAKPCDSLTECPGYVFHVFASPGQHTVRAEAFWDATFTIDASSVQIPVPNGVHRADRGGLLVAVHQAHAVLVPPQ